MDELSLLQTLNRPKNNLEQSEFSPSSKKEDASIQPEILPTLSHTELFSLLKKSTGGDGVAYREEIIIPMIVEEIWRRKEVTFFEKFSIIQELQEIATHYSVGDGYEPSEQGCIDALKTIALQEKNFFLQSTVALFSSETHHDYSLEERYDMLQGNWTELLPLFENGVTHLHTDAKSYSVPGEILSASTVPEKIVREITDQWIHDENNWSTEHQEHDFLQKKRFTEKSLGRILPSSLLPEILPKSTPIDDCYRFGRVGGDFFSSSISTEYGAFYDDLNLVALYPKSTARESSITLDDLNSIGRFLINLKQARPSDFMKAADSTRATLSNVPLPIQRNTFLLEKIQKYADIIMLHRDDFKFDPKLLNDAMFSSWQFPGKERGSDYDKAFQASILQGYQVVISEDGDFDTIYNETLAWLQKEMAASATPSSPIKDIIRTELPDREEEDLIHLSALYQSFSSPRMRVFLEDYFGFPYANIPLRAQLQFINYVHDKSIEDIRAVQSFIQHADSAEARSHRFIVFLALENDIPPDIFYQLDATLTPTIADHVFSKYAELVTTTNSVDSFLRDILPPNKLTGDTSSEIVKKLQQKGSDFLIELATIKHENEASILEKIAGLQTSLELFKATFKTLKDADIEISLEDFQNTSFPSITGSELPKTEVVHMRALYTDSMQGYPEATKRELLADFDQHLGDEKSIFSLLRYKEEVVGFLCFTEEKPGQKYVSAVTLDPRFQKAYIGETMIDEAFAREAENNVLGADCVAEKSVSARYIENGFIGVRSWDDKGDLIMDIVRDDQRNEQYFSTKSLTQEEIVRLAPLGKIGSAHVEVVTDPKEHSFSLCNKGFVLTRYFKDVQTKKWYLVYEPRPVGTQKNSPQSTPQTEELAEV